MPQEEQLRFTAQISIRQLFGLVTCAAIVSLVVSVLPFHSFVNCGVLLLPIVVYCGLRCIGLIFQPAKWIVNQVALFFTIGVMTTLAACSLLGFGWCVLMLPVAAFWLLQVTLLHLGEQLLADLGFTRKTLWGDGYGDRWLLAASSFLAICTLAAMLFATSNSISGSGSALDSYWMIGLLSDSTSFDCQTGFDKQPLTIAVTKGSSVSGRTNADWDVMGLDRYMLGPRRGALHVSHWLTLFTLLVYPAIWCWSWFRPSSKVVSQTR